MMIQVSSIMATTAIQENGMKPLTNGTLGHNVENVAGLEQRDIINTRQEVYPVEEPQTEDDPEIDIVINNVVCSFSVRCHLNLREIALNGSNVVYKRENGVKLLFLLPSAYCENINWYFYIDRFYILDMRVERKCLYFFN